MNEVSSGSIYFPEWDAQLKKSTISVSLILLLVPFFCLALEHVSTLQLIVLVGGPISLLLLCAIFMVGTYEIKNNRLYVERFGWRKIYQLKLLKGVKSYNGSGSRMKIGIPAVFSYSGKYIDPNEGVYESLLTSRGEVLLLEFSDKKVAISPQHKEQIQQELLKYVVAE